MDQPHWQNNTVLEYVASRSLAHLPYQTRWSLCYPVRGRFFLSPLRSASADLPTTYERKPPASQSENMFLFALSAGCPLVRQLVCVELGTVAGATRAKSKTKPLGLLVSSIVCLALLASSRPRMITYTWLSFDPDCSTCSCFAES